MIFKVERIAFGIDKNDLAYFLSENYLYCVADGQGVEEKDYLNTHSSDQKVKFWSQPTIVLPCLHSTSEDILGFWRKFFNFH